jgi:hypothetical protein
MSAPGPVSCASVAPKSLQMMSAGQEAEAHNINPAGHHVRPKRRSEKRPSVIMRP